MLKTILAGLRARTARLVLSSIAIALGVAFVTGTLVLGDAVGEQTRDNFARSARNVDAAVHMGENSPNREDGIPADFLQKIRNTPGVEGADSREFGSAALLSGEGKARSALVQPLPTTEKLRDFDLKDGKFPVKADEAAIDVKTAQVAKLKVGDKLKLLDESNAEHPFTIVGTYQQGASSISMSGSDHVLVSPEGLRTVVPAQRIYEIVAVAKPGVSQQQLVDNVTKAIGTGYEVQTGEQLTQATLAQVGDAASEIKTFLLAFAAISLVVAGMVIYNTFTILVAQRTKELALLRCVGANRSQVFRSVLAEALFMGLTASVLGLLGGVGVSAGLQAFISTVGGPGGEDAPIRLPISWVTIAAGFGVGVVVTVLSAVLPARRATQVAPVAALRSQPDSSDDVARTGKLRIIIATLIALAGGAAVYFGLQQEKEEPHDVHHRWRHDGAAAGGAAARPALRAAGEPPVRQGSARRPGEAGLGQRGPQPQAHGRDDSGVDDRRDHRRDGDGRGRKWPRDHERAGRQAVPSGLRDQVERVQPAALAEVHRRPRQGAQRRDGRARAQGVRRVAEARVRRRHRLPGRGARVPGAAGPRRGHVDGAQGRRDRDAREGGQGRRLSPSAPPSRSAARTSRSSR